MAVDRRTNGEERSRVDEALELAATEAAREAARTTARRAAGGYFLLLLFLLLGAVAYQANTNEKLDHANSEVRDANVRLDRSELRACERLQAQRERTNVSEARQYLLLKAVAASPRASQEVKDRYSALAATTLYDPPTDCAEAVARPITYDRPVSVPFTALPASYVEAIVEAAKEKRPQPTPTP